MPAKRKMASQNGVTRKERRVIIDSSEEEDENGLADGGGPSTADRARREDVENGKEARNAMMLEGEEEDEVVSEIGVFLLPPNNLATPFGSSSSSVGINRLQFPQQHPQLLDRLFSADPSEFSRKCQAQYKAQVRHLKLRFGEEETDQQQRMNAEMAGRNHHQQHSTSGGIADLLMKPSSSSAASPTPSTSNSAASSSAEVFTGEGYSQHGLLSHAVGFFSGGKLFLLPVDKTYEMRKPLEGASEKESTKTAQKAATTASPKASAAASSNSPNLAPLRIRFARTENDFQRRRREQSALFKQKMVEQDQWIPLRVEKAKLAELYAKEAAKATTTGSEQQQEEGDGGQISVKDLLLG